MSRLRALWGALHQHMVHLAQKFLIMFISLNPLLGHLDQMQDVHRLQMHCPSTLDITGAMEWGGAPQDYRPRGHPTPPHPTCASSAGLGEWMLHVYATPSLKAILEGGKITSYIVLKFFN